MKCPRHSRCPQIGWLREVGIDVNDGNGVEKIHVRPFDALLATRPSANDLIRGQRCQLFLQTSQQPAQNFFVVLTERRCRPLNPLANPIHSKRYAGYRDRASDGMINSFEEGPRDHLRMLGRSARIDYPPCRNPNRVELRDQRLQLT
jgi:hypothetical protein